MKLVTYAITPKLTAELKYEYINIIVNDPVDIMLSDAEHCYHIINVLNLNDEQAAELSGGTTEL